MAAFCIQALLTLVKEVVYLKAWQVIDRCKTLEHCTILTLGKGSSKPYCQAPRLVGTYSMLTCRILGKSRASNHTLGEILMYKQRDP